MEKGDHNTRPIKRPSFGMHISEAFRAMSDLRKSSGFRRSFKPNIKGDEHPVLVIPGFMGSNLSTRRLRKFIETLGYLPYDWGLGRNYADVTDVEVLMRRIDTIFEKHRKKISIIGWSLGGVYARELAKSQPDKMRQVITLGSPFSGILEPNNAAWLYQALKGRRVTDLNAAWLMGLPDPAPVPTTAVYSKEDGVVSWKVCMEKEESAIHQNIEVRGSHMGLANNASVWFLIADRLKHKAEDWKHFKYRGEMQEYVRFPNNG